MQGKQTCKILKEIRKQVARANDIEYVVSECQYKGDCLGTCPKCEDVSPLNRLTQARFCCRKCGFEGNADVVAANNILRRGQRLRACGELQSTAAVQVNRPSRKRRAGQQQEPIRRDPQAPENA